MDRCRQAKRSIRRHCSTVTVILTALVCASAASADTGDPASYYGGPVAHSMTGVIVSWGSEINSAYTDATTGDPGLIKYFAASSGGTSDIGGVLAQYLDSSGQNAANQVSYGNQFAITPSVNGSTISDSEIQAELVSQIQAQHLPAPAGNGLSTVYLVLFPAGDTICIDGNTCSGEEFCAYHGSVPLNHNTHVLYAVLPDNTSGPMAQGCGPTSATFLQNQTSYLSHEWSETITDPLVADAKSFGPPLAWYDANCPNQNSVCGEIGDKCNQVEAAEGGWTVQTEWSNLDTGCEPSEPSYSQPTASFVAPPASLAGVPVTFDGSGSSDPSQDQASAQYNGDVWSISPGIASYDWNWGDATADSAGPTATHTYAQAGAYQVSLTVTDDLGFTSTLTRQVSVSGSGATPAPTVATQAASEVSDQAATLNGQIDANGQQLSYRFVYGTAALDQATPVVPGPSSDTNTPVSATISGLSPTTTYQFELEVIAGGVDYFGTTQSLTTNATPPPTSLTTPPAQTPVAGTGGADRISTGAARLNGTVNPDGPAAVTYHFSYGTTPTDLRSSTAQAQGPTGSTATPVSGVVSGSARA